MIKYILKRVLYAIPILIGVNLLTFFLFFVISTPRDMALMQLGDKYTSEASINQWIKEHGYDKPAFYNSKEIGIKKISETLFFEKSIRLFLFDFGNSDSGRDINKDVKSRVWPSLSIAVPAFLLGLFFNIFCAFILVFFRKTYLDFISATVFVAMLSISSLFYIILGQYFFGKILKWAPVSGFLDGYMFVKFISLPVLISVLAGLGSGTRWYRALLIEEMGKDYVRTAKAKGLSDIQILFKHVLKNAMIPILTGVVVVIPGLFLGSLLLESFFGIPGLGNYMVEGIAAQDFAIVRSMVYLGSFVYIIGLLLTDISYTWVDPRVRLE